MYLSHSFFTITRSMLYIFYWTPYKRVFMKKKQFKILFSRIYIIVSRLHVQTSNPRSHAEKSSFSHQITFHSLRLFAENTHFKEKFTLLNFFFAYFSKKNYRNFVYWWITFKSQTKSFSQDCHVPKKWKRQLLNKEKGKISKKENFT